MRSALRKLVPLTVACALVAAGRSLGAQVPVVTVKPLVEHPEALTEPTGLRELRDGRVLISDMREKLVLLLSFEAETATPAAREGAGPLEFRLPGQLFMLGDSVAMPDAMLRRFLVFAPDGKPVRTFPMTGGSNDMMAFVRIGRILGTDSRGRFYSESRGMTIVPGKMPTMSDTAALVRWTTLGEKGDTLATRFEHTEMPAMSGDPSKGIRMAIKMDALTPRDLWDVFPDGRVSLLRVADYQAESIDPTGKRTVGPRVNYTPVPLTAGDRAKLVKLARENYERGLKVGMSMASSMTQGKMPKIDFDIQEPAEWPKQRPPFFGSAAAPNGTLWVSRTMPGLSDIQEYDVLDAGGKLVKRVRFPEKVTLLGFGKGVMYALRKDEDDLRYLQKYKLP
jgi:hypothetical protein